MGTVGQLPDHLPITSDLQASQAGWYAIHTRARHEKKIDGTLRQAGFETYLPLAREVHRWSDRREVVDVPLFACYSFVRMTNCGRERLTILRTHGVLGLVGKRYEGSPIPDHEIEQVRTVIDHKIPVSPYPFLRIGQRVRVRGGVLDGLTGLLAAQKNAKTMVISVDSIERSLAISIDGYDLEPI